MKHLKHSSEISKYITLWYCYNITLQYF